MTREDDSLGVRLLADIRLKFEASKNRKIATNALLQSLSEVDDAPWGGFHEAKGMNARDLARTLKRYGIASRNIRTGAETVVKGYELEDFNDAWSRYSPSPHDSSATLPPGVAGISDPSTASQTDVADVAAELGIKADQQINNGERRRFSL